MSTISKPQLDELLQTLKNRFEQNLHRHQNFEWAAIQSAIIANPQKHFALFEMERTAGEPDVIALEHFDNHYLFIDCCAESPQGRRSICYDNDGLNSRKEHKPLNSAVGMAEMMGIEILDEAQYRQLQKFESCDTKTSSWIKTPPDIRKLGGALFGDYRYGKVFVYHNGAQSYYSARGFRGCLKLDRV